MSKNELRLPRIVRVKSESWKRSKSSFKSSGPSSASKLIFGQRKGRRADFTSRFSSNFGDSSISSLKIQEARAERDRQRALERIHRIAEIREKLEISKRDMIERKRKLAEERKKENRAAGVIQKRTHRFLKYVRERNRIQLNVLQNKSATLLQAHMRKHLGKIGYRQMRTDWTRCSTEIQKKVRSFLQIQHAKRHLAFLRAERIELRKRTIREYYDGHVTASQRHCRGRLCRMKARQVRADIERAEANKREKIKRQKERAMQKAEDAARKLRYMYKPSRPQN